MAKKNELEIISKTNKELALLIDEDLKRESELLQNLIKEVYEANQRVKDSHFRRVQETQAKLENLNTEINSLNKSIDEKDSSTSKVQFNYLLKSKNKIFDALNEVRLYDNEVLTKQPINTHILLLKENIKSKLTPYLESTYNFTETVFTPATKDVLTWAETFLNMTEKSLDNHFINNSNYDKITKTITEHSNDFLNIIENLETKLSTIESKRTHTFSLSLEEAFVDDKIKKMYHDSTTKIKQAIEDEKSSLKEALAIIDKDISTIKQDRLAYYKEKFKDELEKEKHTKNNLNQELEKIRFKIMNAERNQDPKEVSNYLKAYDKLQKQNLSLYEERVKTLADKDAKKTVTNLLKKRQSLELAHQDKIFNFKKAFETEKIKFSESSDLFKIREDQKALENDKKVNKELLKILNITHEQAVQYKIALYDFKHAIETLCLTHINAVYKKSYKQLIDLKKLQNSHKTLHLRLVIILKDKSFEESLIKTKLQKAFDETSINLNYQHAIQKHLKAKLRKEKDVEIETIKAQEDTKNELIYESTQLEIADKEYELQLLKINALYESEVDLTKSQAERLSVGLDVNQTMVKSTVESQIIFAEQQMKFAEKEYQARLENINRSMQQEIAYAESKLERLEHPYLYEIKDLEKARDAKLEDLSYRLALFVEDKDRKVLKEQESEIKAHYQEQIDAIETKRLSNDAIKRYKRQVDAAITRANKAKEDAEHLKDKTIQTFETMLEESKNKLSFFKEQRENTLVPFIESESQTTAKERLDQALKEAKQERDEKLSEPKERINKLEEKLATLESEKNIDLSEYDNTLDTIYREHYDALSKLNDKYKTHFETLSNEKQLSEEKLKKSLDHLKSKQFKLSNEPLKKLKRQTQDQLKLINTEHKSIITTLQKTKTKRKKEYKIKEKQLLSLQNPTINSYKRYLNTASESQKAKLKPIIKNLDEARRNEKANVKGRYN